MSGARQKPSVLLWDIPTRLFHWSVVAIVPLAWWSAETQNFNVHKWLGYTLLVLVASRVVWGFIGSTHSRFADFLVGPAAIRDYLRGLGARSAGHNPLGGWSVVALLTLLFLQALSGLFNSDDIMYSGPLYYWADTGLRGFMGQMHDWAFNGLLALVGLHILAVLYHQLRLREKLLQAMLRGRAEGREGRGVIAAPWLALVVAALLSALLWWLLSVAPQPPPSPW